MWMISGWLLEKAWKHNWQGRAGVRVSKITAPELKDIDTHRISNCAAVFARLRCLVQQETVMSRDVLKQNRSAGAIPARICSRQKWGRQSGQGGQKQIIRHPATCKKSENPPQLRSGFLATAGGKKTLVYWIIDLMRVELKVCCEKKKDFHIHEILFLVNAADYTPASQSRFLFEKDCLTLPLHAITAHSCILISFWAATCLISSPFPLAAFLQNSICRPGVGVIRRLLQCRSWGTTWTTVVIS